MKKVVSFLQLDFEMEIQVNVLIFFDYILSCDEFLTKLCSFAVRSVYLTKIQVNILILHAYCLIFEEFGTKFMFIYGM